MTWRISVAKTIESAMMKGERKVNLSKIKLKANGTIDYLQNIINNDK